MRLTGATKSLAENFADWEGDVFGFGYGTGEVYTIPLLRRFFMCCEGDNGSYNHKTMEDALGAAPAWLLLNTMGHADVIEYGTSPRYGWLTEKGRALRKFILAHTNDELLNMTGRDQNANICSRDACNCGPNGYWEGHKCVNPFWEDEAAREYLKSRPG